MTGFEIALISGWIGFMLGAWCVLIALDVEKKKGARK